MADQSILNHAFHANRVNVNEAWQKLKPFKNAWTLLLNLRKKSM